MKTNKSCRQQSWVSRRRKARTGEDLARLRRAYGSEHDDIKLPVVLDNTVREVEWIKPAGRPRYRRVVKVGSPWEVNIADSKSALEREKTPAVAHVARIFGHTPVVGEAEVIWVELNWLDFRDDQQPDHAIGCPVYERSDGPRGSEWNRMLSPATLIRPVHLLHCCTKDCGIDNGGSSGYKATNKDGRHVVHMGDMFVRNPWYVK